MSLAARFDTKSFLEVAVVAEDTPNQQEMPEATSDLNLCALERSELSTVVDSVRTSLQSATREQQLGGDQLRRLAEREVDEALGKIRNQRSPTTHEYP